MPPECNICSYRQHKLINQSEPLPSMPVYHRHYSTREIRILQCVEYSSRNRLYMCPTCELQHHVRPETGLNICLGDSQLHEFHLPREPGVICRPDRTHVDWVTIPGATIPTLEYAYQVDYGRYKIPMRVLLVAGVNDLLKGGTITITNSILNLKNIIDEQNQFHPAAKNELVVATILNPPKLTWFSDTGPPPPGHTNRLEEIGQLNQWIVEFNLGYGNPTPRFHRFGVKCGRKFVNGASVPLHVHQLKKWRQSEAVGDMVHLNDYWRTRLGAAVVHHFESELEKKGVLS